MCVGVVFILSVQSLFGSVQILLDLFKASLDRYFLTGSVIDAVEMLPTCGFKMLGTKLSAAFF